MKTSPIFLDFETIGFHGMGVLLQYAEGDGDITLYNLWTNPIRQTLKLIEKICNHPDGIVGFNLTFDFFHMCKIYTVFSLHHDWDELPENIIDDIADLELAGRDGPCLKPVKCMDLMLYARKTEYQSTMDRGDIRIKKVPTPIAWQLAGELERRIELKDIYFARNKSKRAERWHVYDITDEDGYVHRDFKDVVLKFNASTALKALAVDALGVKTDELLLYGDIGVNDAYYPEEVGFAPFAKAMGGNRVDGWNKAWPQYIRNHITHWEYNSLARKYAGDDVSYTRRLWEHFGYPELGDDDSELAAMVAAVRWRGYKIDIPKLMNLKAEAIKKVGTTPTAAGPVQHYVLSLLSVTERLVLKSKFKSENDSTKKVILETIAKFTVPCPHCNKGAETVLTTTEVHADLINEFDAPPELFDFKVAKTAGCEHCTSGIIPHPASIRAKEVIDARTAKYDIVQYDKLLLAGRFHASFKVIGTLSSRMSGDDGLNAQGMKKAKEFRQCFPLALEGMILSGGDFAGFEVTLADACYNDEGLRKDLLTCELCDCQMKHVGKPVSLIDFLGTDGITRYVKHRAKTESKMQAAEAEKGKIYVPKTVEEIQQEELENNFFCMNCGSTKGKKIHALFGIHVFPDMTYEQIKATEGTADDRYTRSKQSVFAMIYGGEGPTLQDRLGVDLDTANLAFERFQRQYPMIGVKRMRIIDMFQTMKQVNGIGSKIEWNEPADYIESMLGFRRRFTLENRVCKELFTIANKPPKSWRDVVVKVQRRDREQSASGATQSALFAAAFALQASNTRAAANHEIQSSGGQITKAVQRKIWDLQPSGISDWLVQTMNIHDEIMCPCKPEMAKAVKKAVDDCVESFRPKVPLIRMDWVEKLPTWAEKG